MKGWLYLVEHEYKYYIRKSSWGIYIVINASILQKEDNSEHNCEQISPGLWVANSNTKPIKGDQFIESDKHYLWTGFKNVAEKIVENSPYKEKTLIILNYLIITLSDYQEEGLTPAIMEWASSAFNFESPRVEVNFNKECNKYEFFYPES